VCLHRSKSRLDGRHPTPNGSRPARPSPEEFVEQGDRVSPSQFGGQLTRLSVESRQLLR
jgi:hypothetical protein